MNAQLPVAPRALMTRINRHLQGRQLKRARGSAVETVGDYYLLDTATQQITQSHVDLEAMARSMGQMQAWETAGQDIRWRVVVTYKDGRQVSGRVFQSQGLASRYGDKLMAEDQAVELVSIRREA
jgi:hypothetical protein